MQTIPNSTAAARISRAGLPFRSFHAGPTRRRTLREDRIFHNVLPVLLTVDEFGPGGSRDWGNIILSEADFLSSLYEDRR